MKNLAVRKKFRIHNQSPLPPPIKKSPSLNSYLAPRFQAVRVKLGTQWYIPNVILPLNQTVNLSQTMGLVPKPAVNRDSLMLPQD